MRIFQAVTDFRPNSFWRVRVNFRRRQIFVQLRTENRCKRPTLVADLTNFLFEYFYAVFTHDSFWPFLYHDAKKVKNAKKSNQGGGGDTALTAHSCETFRDNGACAHYIMVSKFQWKPFWLATQRDPQNDWTGTQNRMNYDVHTKNHCFFFYATGEYRHSPDACVNLMIALIWWLRLHESWNFK